MEYGSPPHADRFVGFTAASLRSVRRSPIRPRMRRLKRFGLPVPGSSKSASTWDEIYYVDGDRPLPVPRQFVDTKARSNLTCERVEPLHPLTFRKCALQDAIAIKRSGKPKVGAFADPNRNYCKLEAELEAVDDVTIYPSDPDPTGFKRE